MNSKLTLAVSLLFSLLLSQTHAQGTKPDTNVKPAGKQEKKLIEFGVPAFQVGMKISRRGSFQVQSVSKEPKKTHRKHTRNWTVEVQKVAGGEVAEFRATDIFNENSKAEFRVQYIGEKKAGQFAIKTYEGDKKQSKDSMIKSLAVDHLNLVNKTKFRGLGSLIKTKSLKIGEKITIPGELFVIFETRFEDKCQYSDHSMTLVRTETIAGKDCAVFRISIEAEEEKSSFGYDKYKIQGEVYIDLSNRCQVKSSVTKTIVFYTPIEKDFEVTGYKEEQTTVIKISDEFELVKAS